MYFDKILIHMVIQNDLYCSTIISFPALALVELKGWSTQFLIGERGRGMVQLPPSEKSFVNLFVSFQIKDSDYQYLYL